MNTPALAAATSAATASSAAPNSLCLLSPQRFNTAAPLKHLVPSAEITVGTDPQAMIRRAVNLVAKGPLRNFLRSVMAERDVNQVLTMLNEDGPRFQRLPIDRLRAAAQTASLRRLLNPRARDTLFVAVMVAGIECLLGETVEAPYSTRDVIRSVVRDALRRLHAVDNAQAEALRNVLGWSNADEADDPRTASLQYQVTQAVQSLPNYHSLIRHA